MDQNIIWEEKKSFNEREREREREREGKMEAPMYFS